MGARLVLDLNPSGSSSPQSMVSIDGMLYFTADLGSSSEGSQQAPDSGDDVNNEEESAQATTPQSANTLGSGLALLKSDGTADGTRLLKEFQSINDLVEVNGELYFIADDGTGNRLWESDGTARGTELVKDLYPGADPNFPQDLFEIDGVLFYSAIDGTGDDGKYPYVNGYEVWRREGNEIGSRFFRNLIPDKIITDTDISEEEIETFPLDQNGNPIPLEKKTSITTTFNDGITTTTTIITEQIFIEGAISTNRSEKIERAASVESDIEGTTTDTETTFATTTRIDYTAAITTEIFENDSFPKSFIAINGNYFFAAHSSAFYNLETRTAETLIGGLELWFSDGTESGTRPININQNNYTFYEPEDGEYTPAEMVGESGFGFAQQSSSSFPRELTKFNNDLVLVANDGLSGFELWTVTDQGGNPRQIADISEGNTSSSPEELTVVGNRLYFTANDKSGRKLWSLTNTLGQPTLVEDAGKNPKHLSAINGQLYFSAESELGRELWIANGSSASLAADINPGSGSSSPKDFSIVNHWVNQNIESYLYFSANGGARGAELWALDLRSNDNAPQRQADIFSGPYSSEPRQLTKAEENLFFTADDGDCGRELWTLGVSIIGPSGKIGPNSTNIEANENQTYVHQFSSDASVSWNLNGGSDENLFELQENGTLSFKQDPVYDNPRDLNRDNTYEVIIRATDTSNGIPTNQKINVEVNDVVNIGNSGDNADENGNGNESNGSEDFSDIIVTERQKNIYQFNTSENIEWTISGDDAASVTIKSKGLLRFIDTPIYDQPADTDQDNIYEISLKASNPNSGSSDEQNISIEVAYVVDIQGPSGQAGAEQSSIKIPENNKYVFDFTSSKKANWELAGGEDQNLFKIKSNGSLKFKQTPDFENPLDSNDNNIYKVIVGARNPEIGNLSEQAVEIEIIDTHTSTSGLIKNIYSGPTSSNPSELIQFKNGLFFAAEKNTKGIELWKSEGSKATTTLLKDINPGKNSSIPDGFTLFEDKLYFSANDGKTGTELWRTDGTSKGTTQVKDLRSGSESSSPSNFAVLDNKLIFAADEGNDGTELWGLSKGSNNPGLIRDINPNTGSAPKELTNFKQKIYFSAEGKIYGRELWGTDGTKDGTELVFDINPGGFDGNPLNLTVHGEKMYFTAETYAGGRQIWSSDGTSSGTSKISPLSSQNIFSNVEGLTSTGEQLFFSANSNLVSDNDNAESQQLGRELWSMRENLDSINLVLDINPGSAGSNPTALTSVDNILYFSADNGTHGEELWMSDGSSEGTFRLTDINKGAKNSSPRDITEGPDGIYFSAIKDKVGRELWRLADDSKSATHIVTAGKGKKKLRALDDSNDEFRFELANQFGKAKADQITGFRPNEGDQLVLSTNAFPGLAEINLVTVSSKRQLKAQQTQPSNVIYYEAKGTLYFDQNETNKGYGEDGGLFAILKGGPDLTESSFLIV